jgi:hypothetical protein
LIKESGPHPPELQGQTDWAATAAEVMVLLLLLGAAMLARSSRHVGLYWLAGTSRGREV